MSLGLANVTTTTSSRRRCSYANVVDEYRSDRGDNDNSNNSNSSKQDDESEETAAGKTSARAQEGAKASLAG
jgi:hypothetical protein